MPRVYFITHPEVRFDWTTPVPQWDLSDVGQARLEGLVRQPWLASLRGLYSSPERKAVTAAERIAVATGLTAHYMPELAEIDRSAAGTLPPEEYDAVTEAFFAEPDQSARGWERAADAQRRIVGALTRIVGQNSGQSDIAIVSHGGVGTLLLCHLQGSPIRRSQDQPGQGHYFVFDSATGEVEQEWRRIDAGET